jgi:hypothetical protein
MHGHQGCHGVAPARSCAATGPAERNVIMQAHKGCHGAVSIRSSAAMELLNAMYLCMHAWVVMG